MEKFPSGPRINIREEIQEPPWADPETTREKLDFASTGGISLARTSDCRTAWSARRCLRIRAGEGSRGVAYDAAFQLW